MDSEIFIWKVNKKSESIVNRLNFENAQFVCLRLSNNQQHFYAFDRVERTLGKFETVGEQDLVDFYKGFQGQTIGQTFDLSAQEDFIFGVDGQQAHMLRVLNTSHKSFEKHDLGLGPIECLQMDRATSRLLAGSKTRMVGVVDCKDPSRPQLIASVSNAHAISSLAFFSSGSFILVSQVGLKLWNLIGGKLGCNQEAHESGINVVGIDKKAGTIWAGGSDNRVLMGKLLKVFQKSSKSEAQTTESGQVAARAGELTREISQCEGQISELKSEIEKIEQNLQRQESKKEEILDQSRSMMEKMSAEEELKLERLTSEQKELNRQVQRNAAEIEDLLQKKNNLWSLEIQKDFKDMGDYARKLEKAREKYQGVKGEIEAVKADCEKYLKKNEKYKKKQKELEESIRVMQEKIKELESSSDESSSSEED